ncbi:MAG: excinuclease ABC subunit UvrC [Pseudomonadota bacterium]
MPVDEEFLKNLPLSPGVYLMADRTGKILYVGKASNLRNRVRSYFVKGGDERPRIQFLMDHVDNIRTILTNTEKEALILENNLIKQHRPKYNVDLMDDKSFFSLRLNVSHPFPRLTLVRTQKIVPDGERYFGPYSSARDARLTLKFILTLFPLRQCSEQFFRTCKRPCLNCQMGACTCPCSGKVDRDEYRRMVEGVALLLQGKSEDLVGSLKRDMVSASGELRFEEAAGIRDRIAAVERTLEIQNVSFFHLKDQDAVGLVHRAPDLYVVQVLSFRKGRLLSEESYRFRNEALEAEEIMASAVKQFYGAAPFIPKEVLVSHPIENPEVVEAWLSEQRGNRVSIRAPSRGQGLRLVKLALKNAHNSLLMELKDDGAARAMERIARKLGLPSPPSLIEGYDISNHAGTESVGAKIAFLDGKPSKDQYRKYKITGFEDQDDPGMIYHTLSRRLAHADEDRLPDLFLIDGGKSQLNAAVAALKDALGELHPPVASIAKGRQEGELDRIYLPNRKNAVTFMKGDAGLLLLMRVRDESHRFVHGFHTKTRAKSVIHSALDEVSGIGPRKKQALLTAFGSLKKLLAASDEDIAKVPGIGLKDVERIRAHFAGTDKTA